MEHEHEHTHTHSQEHTHEHGEGGNIPAETVALLNHMAGHNADHAAELAKMVLPSLFGCLLRFYSCANPFSWIT